MLKINRERSKRRKKMWKISVLGIKNLRSAAVRGGAPGAPHPPGSASAIRDYILTSTHLEKTFQAVYMYQFFYYIYLSFTLKYHYHHLIGNQTSRLLKSKILDFETWSDVHFYRIEYVSYRQDPYRLRIDTAADRIVPALESSDFTFSDCISNAPVTRPAVYVYIFTFAYNFLNEKATFILHDPHGSDAQKWRHCLLNKRTLIGQRNVVWPMKTTSLAH